MNFADLRAIKCKTCGEPLDLNLAQNGVIKCAICDSVFTLPKVDASQKVLDFLSQGEHDLDTCRFDDAYTAFNKACELDKTEPEAYWGMALAEFKIQYLKDEVNNRLQPICHEISDKDFADSSNFLRATRYATEAQRAEYERKAEEINYIKNEFYKIAKTGAKYDCFICVKVTDENGGKTQDYKAADDIYFELKGKGYKPFFSERELRGVTGADYEARILYALQSAECMLVVCFDEAYLRTKWVKNEYTRFLKLVNDEEKESDSIALVFGNRPVEKLPGKKGKIQGIALNSLTAMERIVQFVDSHTPEARKRREEALLQQEKEAKKRAKEDEAQRKKFAEQEERIRQQEELIRKQQERFNQIEEMLKAQQSAPQTAPRQDSRQAEEEKPKRQKKEQAPTAQPATQSEEELFARFEQMRQEKERKEKEEKARQEQIKRDFEIKNGELVKFGGWGTLLTNSIADIPDSVKSIGREAFYKKKVTKVTIPNSVTSIGESAFSGCTELKELTIPDSVKTIGKHAFSSSGLTSIKIPNGVTRIETDAFSYCRDLKSVEIPKSVTEIGESAFSNCSALERIVIPGSVKTIDKWAFGNCDNLKSVEIPDGVTTIGAFAFRGCKNLKKAFISESVKQMGKEVFMWYSELFKENYEGVNTTIYCYAEKKPEGWDKDWNVKIQASKSTKESRHRVYWDFTGEEKATRSTKSPQSPKQESAIPPVKNMSAEVSAPVPSKEEISKRQEAENIARNFVIKDSYLVKYKGKDGNVAIPDGVQVIDKEAFLDRKDITSVIIPNSVKVIREDAFRGCSGLESVTIPDSVIQIWHRAFSGCGRLGGVIIPESVETMSFDIFNYCHNIIICCRAKNKPEKWNRDWANERSGGGPKYEVIWGFTGDRCPTREELEEAKQAERKAEIDKKISVMGNIALPESLDEAERLLREFKIEKCVLVKYTGANTNVIIPDGVTEIGEKAFRDNDKITSVTIPNSVTKIGEEAFRGCSGLLSVNLPDSVTKIGKMAFYSCGSLKSIILPNKIERIEDHVFRYCDKLTNVTIPNSVKYIGELAFYGNNILADINIPDSVLSIGRGAFYSCQHLNKIIIPEGVTQMGDEVFYIDWNLTIYCRAKKRPNGWDKNWDKKEDKLIGGRHKVVWGYTGD